MSNHIGTARVETESGTKDLPLFDPAHADFDEPGWLRIETPSGTGAVRLVDVSDAQIDELRVQTPGGLKAASTNLGGAPSVGMFSSPIYQFPAGEYGGSDGDVGFGYPEVLAGLPNATAVGDPVYRADQSGWAAAEYDGSDDGHDFSPDSQLPTGDEQFSLAALLWAKSTTDLNTVASWGTDNFNGDGLTFGVNSGEVQLSVAGEIGRTGGSVPTGQWVTISGTYDGSGIEIFLDGSSVATGSASGFSLNDANHSLGYRKWYESNTPGYADIYLAELVVCDTGESSTAISNYHQDRIG